MRERGQVDRQLVERADVTGQPDLADQDRTPAILVPHRDGGPVGHQAKLKQFLRGGVGAGEGARRLPQCRRCGARPVEGQQGKAVQQQVKRAWGLLRRAESLGGAGDLPKVAGAR